MSRYIDADALYELIDGGYDVDFDEVPETKKALLAMIDYQETADVAPVRHGKWIEREVSDGKVIDEWQSAKCSACGRYNTIPYIYFFRECNYCPNCGAKNKESEEST